MDADPYAALGVSRTAATEEIHEAYRKLLQTYHPDVFQGDPAVATAKTEEINGAYEVLRDPERRKEYDLLHEAVPPEPSSVPRAEARTVQDPTPTERGREEPVPTPPFSRSAPFEPPPTSSTPGASLGEYLDTNWKVLAHVLKQGEGARVGGRTFTKADCCLIALEVDADDTEVWVDLGIALLPGGTAPMGDRDYSSRECFVRALELDPGSVTGWSWLGKSMREEESVIVSAVPFSKRECVLMAQKLGGNETTALLHPWETCSVARDAGGGSHEPRCPECGASNSSSSVVCSRCGTPLTPGGPAASPTQPDGWIHAKFCPSCRIRTDQMSPICPECGAQIPLLIFPGWVKSLDHPERLKRCRTSGQYIDPRTGRCPACGRLWE